MSGMNPQAAPVANAIRWSEAQLAAIGQDPGNMVITASAGSGKTAVLTERVVRRVTQGMAGSAPEPLEKLLIITFTEKAAREMRERIEKKLIERQAREPDNLHVAAAIDALPGAWIMTIDAFCRRIVTEYFHRAGVSPNPRVLTGPEQKQLESATAADAMRAWAADERRDALMNLREVFGGEADLTHAAKSVIDFEASLDSPAAWRAEVLDACARTETATTFGELPEYGAWRELVLRDAADMMASLRDLIRDAQANGGDAAILTGWGELAGRFLETVPAGVQTPDTLRAALEAGGFDATFGKLMNKGVCGAALYQDPEFKKHMLEPFAERYTKYFRDRYFGIDEAAALRASKLAAHWTRHLLALADDIAAAIDAEKQRRGCLTFNDIQRKTLELLLDPNGDPTDVAYAMQRRFNGVMVDEFQDTSPLQDAIVRMVSQNLNAPPVKGNLFLVGDYKQSIYRFRFAEPALFLGKLQTAAQGRPPIGEAQLYHAYSLRENYRSHAGAIEFINRVFTRLMDTAVGDVAYAPDELMVARREVPAGLEEVCIEAHWLPRSVDVPPPRNRDDDDGDDDKQDDDADTEPLANKAAHMAWVARRIGELTDAANPTMIPGDDGALRPLAPGDCAILVRSLKGEMGEWVEALESAGLKVHAVGDNPIGSATELTDLVNMLRLLDNPLQDHPLAAVMRSPLANFSDEELLRVRMRRACEFFHEAVFAAAGRALDGGEDPELARHPIDAALEAKLAAFLDRLESWRRQAERQSLVELIERILTETGYESYLMAQPEAELRVERLDYLRGLARQFEAFELAPSPLAGFLEMIEQAEAGETELADLPEPTAGEGEAVHLLTIHKSKGLEFPVVFLPRLERKMKVSKSTDLLLDREWGLGVNGVDLEARRKLPTLRRLVIDDARHRAERSEELRVLYVALTRAEFRLVLSGQFSDIGQARARWRSHAAGEGAMDPWLRLRAGSYADLLGPVIEELAAAEWPGLSVTEHEALPARREPQYTGAIHTALLEAEATDGQSLESLGRELQRELGPDIEIPARRWSPRHDPAAALTHLRTKWTVTQLRQRRAEQAVAGQTPDHPDTRESYFFMEEEMLPDRAAAEARLGERKPVWLDPGDSAKLEGDGSLRGRLTHALLAALDLRGDLTVAGLERQAMDLLARGVLARPGLDADTLRGMLDFAALAWFFETPFGGMMTEPMLDVRREMPFTMSASLGEFDPDAARQFPTEQVLVQGIVDVVICDENRAVVLDYKTDKVWNEQRLEELTARYAEQLRQYARAIRVCWNIPQVESHLIFLDTRQCVEISVK